MDTQKNHGVLIAPPGLTDYILGTTSPLKSPFAVINWEPFLPDVENQYSSKTDYLNCVTMSGIHIIETELNYLLAAKKFSDEAINFFTQNKYISGGKFRLSARFNAKLNNTDGIKGNYINAVAEAFRRDGCMPDSMWPASLDITWSEYYKSVPQSLIDLGKKFLWFINPTYQWIERGGLNKILLQGGPVQVATEICAGWDSGNIVPKCSGQAIQHATVIYGISLIGTYLDLDQYPPYKQELAYDYELNNNIQYIVSLKPISLRNGMNGMNVLNMQTNLKKLGYKINDDSFFGEITKGIVMEFQKDYGLVSDGIAGTLTLAKIASLVAVPTNSNKIDLWCEAIKDMENAKPSRNNPGNIRYYAGVQNAVNDGGFCKFDTYQHGYDALKMLITNACSGRSKVYNSNGNMYDFFAVYAPSSDKNDPKGYAEFVAKRMNVDPLTIIKTLI